MHETSMPLEGTVSFNNNYVMPQGQDNDKYEDKKMKEFTLLALNGILQLLN
jgi:hypothetical protein